MRLIRRLDYLDSAESVRKCGCLNYLKLTIPRLFTCPNFYQNRGCSKYKLSRFLFEIELCRYINGKESTGNCVKTNPIETSEIMIPNKKCLGYSIGTSTTDVRYYQVQKQRYKTESSDWLTKVLSTNMKVGTEVDLFCKASTVKTGY